MKKIGEGAEYQNGSCSRHIIPCVSRRGVDMLLDAENR